MKKVFDIELITIGICLLFSIVISFYHVSYNGFMGLSSKSWSLIWALGENGLSLIMSITLAIMTIGVTRMIFKFVFIPYFSIKLLYHISCYSGIVLMPVKAWERIWSLILVALIIITLFYCRTLIKKQKYVA